VADTHNFIIAKGTITNSNSKKRKLAKDDDETTRKKKRIKVSSSSDNTQISPVGLSWDSKDWSCAYDAIFTILHDIWIQNPNKWFRIFSLVSKPLEMLVVGFKETMRAKTSLKKSRNKVRNMLHSESQEMFPKGATGTSIIDLARKLLNGTESFCYAKIQCAVCNAEMPTTQPDNLMYIHSRAKSINEWFKSWQEESIICNGCNSQQTLNRGFVFPPEILVFSLESNNVAISKTVKVNRGTTSSIPLRGIIYLANFHFTSRIISNKDVWFHDGIVTKTKCRKEGHITDFDEKKFRYCNNAQAVLAIYAKK
jgi:hypothetical protein